MDEQDHLQERIDRILERIWAVQKAIRSSGQPPSQREIGELKELGAEYGRIIGELDRFQRSTRQTNGDTE